MIIDIVDARDRLAELIERARSGGDVVIVDRGRPAARLVQVDERCLGNGNVADILGELDGGPLPFRRRHGIERIDADLEDERASWE